MPISLYLPSYLQPGESNGALSAKVGESWHSEVRSWRLLRLGWPLFAHIYGIFVTHVCMCVACFVPLFSLSFALLSQGFSSFAVAPNV